MGQIPVIDISPAVAPTGGGAVVGELRRARTEVDFLQITGYGIALEKMAAVYDSVTAPAGFSAEEKTALVPPTGHQFRSLVGGRTKTATCSSSRFRSTRPRSRPSTSRPSTP